MIRRQIRTVDLAAAAAARCRLHRLRVGRERGVAKPTASVSAAGPWRRAAVSRQPGRCGAGSGSGSVLALCGGPLAMFRCESRLHAAAWRRRRCQCGAVRQEHELSAREGRGVRRSARRRMHGFDALDGQPPVPGHHERNKSDNQARRGISGRAMYIGMGIPKIVQRWQINAPSSASEAWRHGRHCALGSGVPRRQYFLGR